jgi:flavin-dependent dehydrogenase
MFDAEIGVVGAGPAGARAAELLSRHGAEVLLLDPRAPWEKPCGGGLTGSAFREIPDLTDVQALARRIGRVRLETSTDAVVDLPLDHPLFVVARIELSKWQLRRAVGAGAVFRPEAVKRIVPANPGWNLKLADGAVCRVRRVIGADGAASTVRKAVAPDIRVELAPTRVLYAHGPGPAADAIAMRFVPGVRGYAWNFPRPDHRSIGVGVEPGDWSRSQLDADLERYWEVWGRCECVAAVRAGAVIGTAMRGMPAFYPAIGGLDFALLGDAAGFADPATGEGIQNALRSGEMVAEAFAAEGTFAAYPRIAFAGFEKEFGIARRVRRALYVWNLPVHLIGAARRHRSMFALLAAVANGGNEHDPRLLRRWLRQLRNPVRRSAPLGPVPRPVCRHDAIASSQPAGPAADSMEKALSSSQPRETIR